MKFRGLIASLLVYAFVQILVCGCGTRDRASDVVLPPGATQLEGVIIERSQIPDPKGNAYPNLLFTAEVAVQGISGGQSVPANIAVAFPGFFDRALRPEAKLRESDTVRLVVCPLDELDEAIRSMQQADTVTRFDLDLYYAITTSVIAAMSDNLIPPAPNAKLESLSEAPNPIAPTASEREARARAIQDDLDRIDRQIEAHGNDWARWVERLAPYRQALRDKLQRNNNYLLKWPFSFSSTEWMDYEFDPSEPIQSNMIDALVQLNQRLRRYGIDLIVAFIPERDSISAPHFLESMPADGVLQPYRLRILRTLLARDIEILDMVDYFRATAETYPPMYYYHSADHHPADGATIAAAELIQKRLARYEFVGPTQLFVTHDWIYPGPYPLPQYGTTRPKLNGVMVLNPDQSPFALPKGAPIVFIGDSFLVSPNDYGMNYGDVARHVARLTGRMPSVFIRNSGTQMMAQYLARTPRTFFANRKAFVFYAGFHNLRGKFVPYWVNLDIHQRHNELVGLRDAFERGVPVDQFPRSQSDVQWTLEPSDPRDAHADTSIAIFQTNHTRRLRLPAVEVEPDNKYLVRIDAKSGEYGAWYFTANDQAPIEMRILKGRNRQILAVRPSRSPLKITYEFPPGEKSILVNRIDIRRAAETKASRY